MKAKEFYSRYRSCTFAVYKDGLLEPGGMVCGYMGALIIVGYADDEHPIKDFNINNQSLQLVDDSGRFANDGKNNENPTRSFSLVNVDDLYRVSSAKTSRDIFLKDNYVGCLADHAPVDVTEQYMKEHECSDSGYCHKHHVPCMLWFNHSCVNDGRCKLTRTKDE